MCVFLRYSFQFDGMANVVWTKEDILTLLEAYTDRYRQFNIGNFRPQDWDYVLISVNANKQAGMSDKTRQQVKNKMENMKKKYRQEKGAQRAPGLRSKWSYYTNMDRIFGNNPRIVGILDIENPVPIAVRHSSEPAPLRVLVKSEEGCSPRTPVIQVRPSIDLKESEELLPESPCPAEDEDTPRSAETPRTTSAQVEDAPGIHSSLSGRRGKKRRHNSYYSPAKALAGAITKFGELCTQLERDRAKREERRAEREERRQKENADREERILKMQMDMQLRLAELFTLGQNRGSSGGEEAKK